MAGFLSKRNKDYYGGVLMLLMGLGAILEGARYSLGTLSRMGPGFFPVSLGVILTCLGLGIAVGGRWAAPDDTKRPLPPEWRGWSCICLSIVAFAVLGHYFGLLPATFAIVFISALGNRQNTVRDAGLLAAAVSVVNVVTDWSARASMAPFTSYMT